MSSFELKEEQRRAIYGEDGKNLMVSASAGSGKTFVMIERIIRLIREKKLSVNGLLAVTFTEKAAFEMREKLSDALIESINKGEREFKEELLDLPMADICTIDAFCSRLVKRYFYKLGIDRDFEILSDIERNRLSSEAMSEVFDNHYKSASKDFLMTVQRFANKRSDRELREQVERIYLFASSERSLEDWFNITDTLYTENGLDYLETEFLKAIKAKFKNLKASVVDYADYARENGYDDCADYAVLYNDYITAFEEVNSIYGFSKLKDFDEPPFPKATGKKLEQEHKDFRDSFKKHFREEKKKIDAMISVVTDRDNTRGMVKETFSDYSVIKNLVIEYEKVFDRLKREENKFEFHDISRFALRLLEIEEVREEVSAKYQNVFIDEYQDVNAVQERIFDLISNDNCFMVGDVKQSIYGFRGCNCKLFEEKFKKLSKTNSALWLNHNFRSASAILDSANEIFTNVITAEDFGVDYKDARLIPGGTYPEDDYGRCKLHVVVKPKKQKDAKKLDVYDIAKDGDSLFDEEYLTALKVREIIQEELGKTYYDMKTHSQKPVTMSDIAILTRTTTRVATEIVVGLAKYGIKVSSEVEINCLQTKEVELLVDYLKILSCLEQERPLAVCMLSSIGGFTPSELSQIIGYSTDKETKERFLDGYKNLLTGEGELSDKVRAFNNYINTQRFVADYYGAKTALENVIRDKNIDAGALVKKLGTERERKIERFLTESVSAGRNLSVDEFLYKIKNSPSSFTLTGNSGGDAVTLITSHKSKGLEYPVVILIGLEGRFNNTDASDKILLDRDAGMALYTYDDEERSACKNILRELIKHKITARQTQDEARLFYVATTRAKYSMHLVSIEDKFDGPIPKQKTARRFYEFIPSSFVRQVTLGEDLIGKNKKDEPTPVVVGKRNEDLINLIKRNLTFEYPYLQDVSLPLKTSVTANLNAKTTEEPEVVLDFNFPDEEVITNRITTQEGIVAHKIMEHYDFKSDADFDAQVNGMLLGGVVTTEELSTVNYDNLKTAVSLSVFSSLKDYEIYKEQYFVCQVPAKLIIDGYDGDASVLLQGVTDLLAVKDGEAIIIDYKYSAKSKENLLKTYAKQLRLYKYAVEVSLGVKVTRTALVSLLSGETVEVD